MNYLKDLSSSRTIFFNFMKEKYPVYTNSNIFFRDIQYAICSYYKRINMIVKYPQAEKIASDFIKQLELEGQLKNISSNGWKVNFSLEKNVAHTSDENTKSN